MFYSLMMLAVGIASPLSAHGHYWTDNFTVTAPTFIEAVLIAITAEQCREQIARDWIGKDFPRWYRRCTVKATLALNLEANGATSFSFSHGKPVGWRMTVEGPLEQVIGDVIPHETSHIVMHMHFSRPLPRWADEGMATVQEYGQQRLVYQKLTRQVLDTPNEIPLNDMLTMVEYPAHLARRTILYAQASTFVEFLLYRGGSDKASRRMYIKLITDAHATDWPTAFGSTYGYKELADLEQE